MSDLMSLLAAAAAGDNCAIPSSVNPKEKKGGHLYHPQLIQLKWWKSMEFHLRTTRAGIADILPKLNFYWEKCKKLNLKIYQTVERQILNVLISAHAENQTFWPPDFSQFWFRTFRPLAFPCSNRTIFIRVGRFVRTSDRKKVWNWNCLTTEPLCSIWNTNAFGFRHSTVCSIPIQHCNVC